MNIASELIQLLGLLAIGVLVVFGVCVSVDMKMKRSNRKRREESMKVQSQEPGRTDGKE